MEIFDLPNENIKLPNENIGLHQQVGHGRTGTSAWFFPFTTDYFTVPTKVTKKVLLKKCGKKKGPQLRA
jgi:hypothetical protein